MKETRRESYEVLISYSCMEQGNTLMMLPSYLINDAHALRKTGRSFTTISSTTLCCRGYNKRRRLHAKYQLSRPEFWVDIKQPTMRRMYIDALSRKGLFRRVERRYLLSTLPVTIVSAKRTSRDFGVITDLRFAILSTSVPSCGMNQRRPLLREVMPRPQ